MWFCHLSFFSFIYKLLNVHTQAKHNPVTIMHFMFTLEIRMGGGAVSVILTMAWLLMPVLDSR